MQYLDFEQQILEIDTRLADVSADVTRSDDEKKEDTVRLNKKREKTLESIYSNLTPWQKSAVARHESRPHTSDYINSIFQNFSILSGDRSFADDKAIIGGFADFEGQTVMVIGHEKGHDTESRLAHNFGMAKPEGYRKAIRLMKLAEQFNVPVITLVDTAGAFPGMEGEERGQGQAIAASTEACLDLKVPLICCIIGEGGSGGAIALASGNKILMLENSIYSVISPEGCASILWKDAKMAPKAAEILNLTASDLLRLGIIDEVVPEPVGGAHRYPNEAMGALASAIKKHLDALKQNTPDELKAMRHDKFYAMTRLGEE